jgi:hypothetical protein
MNDSPNRFSGHVDVASRFSGQDDSLIDFPVHKPERISGLKMVTQTLVLMLAVVCAIVLAGGAVVIVVGVLAMYVQGFMAYPIVMSCVTLVLVIIYVGCHVAVKRGYTL